MFGHLLVLSARFGLIWHACQFLDEQNKQMRCQKGVLGQIHRGNSVFLSLLCIDCKNQNRLPEKRSGCSKTVLNFHLWHRV